MTPFRSLLSCLACALLAGCASLAAPTEESRLSDDLVELAQQAIATARSGEDIRKVLRHALQARSGHVVMLSGHRFVLAPATLDRLVAGDELLAPRYRTLVAQTLEFAEQKCLAFAPAAPRDDFRLAPAGAGDLAVTLSAEERQLVSVGIELRGGCIVAMHFEQASADARD